MYKTSVYTLVAVNKCRPIGLNRCFVHLYLLFYHKNQVLCWWSIINHLLSTAMKKLNLKYFGVTILIFRGHVTSSITWPSDSAWALFLLVVNDDHAPILHRYGDTGLQRFWGHEFVFWGSRDVIGDVTIGLGTCGFLLAVHWNHTSILHRYGDIKPQSCICPC